ncbi:MAG TPA: hypothetical protein PK082_07520 [Phycisphaerae bacterium]|nr:hypothetical protein [Phycisphaerae bacterium]
MLHMFSLSDDELEALEEILQRELESTRMESRRTRLTDYRERVHHRMDVIRRLLDVLSDAKHHAGV